MSCIPAFNKCTLHSLADDSFSNVLSIYTCAQDDCSREYDSVRSFKKYLRIKHPIKPHIEVEEVDNAVLALTERTLTI